MYCLMCGSQIGDKLNYCNKCGMKLVKEGEARDKSPKSILELMVTSVSIIAISGLGILVGLVAILLGNNLPNDMVAIISIFYLMALSGICFMLLRPISKLVNAQIEQKGENVETYRPPQLAKPEMAALNEPFSPVASVTEHTTRTLDEVKIER